MSYRKPLQWPEESLQIKSTNVMSGDENLPALFEDMIDTLKVEKGAGIAAPQIGINQNVIVVDISEWGESASFIQKLTDELVEGRYWFLLNPKLDTSDQLQRWSEGCLSVPWVSADVERSSVCSVNYLTRNFESKIINLPWPLSGAVQHECDHLEGKLFLDRISRLKSKRLKSFIVKKRKKINFYKEGLLRDTEEKKIGGKKRNSNLGKKEIKKRKDSKKFNSRFRGA